MHTAGARVPATATSRRRHRKDCMTTTSSLSTETSPRQGSATAEVCASVDELKQRIFDATPMGLCLLIRAQPVLINARLPNCSGLP